MIELGIWEMSSTPFFRSSTNSSFSVSQIFFVRVGRRRQERLVAVVRLVVLLDEVADVDLLLPEARPESLPRRQSLASVVFVALRSRP